MAASTSKLFEPIQLGAVRLNHRVAMTALTRMKASASTHVPHVELVKEYYVQRSCSPGTLLISEATIVTPKAGVFAHVPGIWSEEQIDAWRTIVDGVHAKNSFIFSQLYALGRAADYKASRAEDPSIPYIAPSAIKLTGKDETPRALTVDEINEIIQSFSSAASNAVKRAGFDGVEIHASYGYLIDQFLQDMSNTRTDQYGGSIENRARFALEVLDAVVSAVGEDRTAIRFTPWSEIHGMRMDDPKPTFSYLVAQIKARYPNLAYIHIVEPRITADSPQAGSPNDFIREIWAPKTLISAGSYTRTSALAATETDGNVIAFGKHFLANPDLVERLRKDAPLNVYNPEAFYLPGSVSRGYTDYPSCDSK